MLSASQGPRFSRGEAEEAQRRGDLPSKLGDKCQEDLEKFLQRHCFEGLKQKLPPKVNANCIVSFESLTPIEVAEPWPFRGKLRLRQSPRT